MTEHSPATLRQRSWPERFQVTIISGVAPVREFRVTTWRGPEKAVALAVINYLGAFSSTPPSIDDVTCLSLGPAPRHRHGTVEVPKGDLFDRQEF
jgi:hypothetical protein